MKPFLYSLVLSLCVGLLPARGVQAEDLDDVIHAMREGNFAEAYCILKPYADAGDADAQYNIGWMYLNGYGLAINDSLALEWWQRASDQGHTDASFSIAMLYNLGEGQVEKDMDRAIDYYLLALEDGHEDARLILRSMLQRNDRSIRERRQQIINTYGSLLGDLKQVTRDRVNVRSGPGMDNAIIHGLVKGDVVLSLGKQGNWSNVILRDSGKEAWVYSTLLDDYEIEVVEEEVEDAPAPVEVAPGEVEEAPAVVTDDSDFE